MNIQGWFPLGLIDLISLLSKRLSRVLSSTTVWKHQFFSSQPSLWSDSNIQRSPKLQMQWYLDITSLEVIRIRWGHECWALMLGLVPLYKETPETSLPSTWMANVFSCVRLFAVLWLYPIRLLCPWDYPCKNTGVGCHFLLCRSSRPRDQTCVSWVSCIGRSILYHWAIREVILCESIDKK